MVWDRIGLAHAALQNQDTLDKVAHALSYGKQAHQTDRSSFKIPQDQSRKTSKPDTPAKAKRLPAIFIKLHSRTRFTRQSDQPAYLEDPSQALQEDTTGSYFFPWAKPLFSMAQLAPLFFSGLGQKKGTVRLDQKKLLSTLANGKPLTRLPCLQQQRWPERLQIIVDTANRLEPYWHDFEYIVTSLRNLLGKEAVETVRFLDHVPVINGKCVSWPQQNSKWDWYSLPSTDVSVLILSDFGQFGGKEIQTSWEHFAEKLLRHSAPVISLSPAAKSPTDSRLCRKLRPIPLNDHQTTPRVPGKRGFQIDGGNQTETQIILTLLAALPVVSCSLLRPLRQELHLGSSDFEGMLWNHNHLQPVSIGKYICGSKKKAYHGKYCDLKKEYQNDPVKNIIFSNFWQICNEHHKNAFEGLRMLQTFSQVVLENKDIPGQIKDYLRHLAGTVWRGGNSHNGKSRASQGGILLELMPELAWKGSMRKELHAIYGAIHREEIVSGRWPEQMPESVDPNSLNYIVNDQNFDGQVERWTLVQVGDQGKFQLLKVTDRSPSHNTPFAGIGAVAGQPLFISVPGGGFRYKIDENVEITPPLLQKGITEQDFEIRFLGSHRSSIREVINKEKSSIGFLQIDSVSASESIRLEYHPRLQWMEGVKRHGNGLTVITESADKSSHEYEWLAGEHDYKGKITRRAVWFQDREKESSSTAMETVKQDQYGIYTDLTIKDTIQRFRWCEPGSFLMGSPLDESGRFSDEALHEVILSRGFWLAETTVTQSLWQMVMGENLSRFKGVDLPVENVSWKDIQTFIIKLNRMLPEIAVRLPWEAEWEYACRAGTTTAFSFGGKEDLSLERVNYSGKWDDYNLKGETKEVKSYPPNTWGLYEMHGNVWEWCADYWQDDLGVDPVVDPHGPENGDSRVVRGGSWFNFGGSVRSAIRYGRDPGLRYDDLGFRLALGHELK